MACAIFPIAASAAFRRFPIYIAGIDRALAPPTGTTIAGVRATDLAGPPPPS